MIKVLLSFAATSSLAFALTNNCPVGSGPGTLSGNPIPSAASNSVNVVNSQASGDVGFPSGCGWIDKVFSSFTVTSSLDDNPENELVVGDTDADGVYFFIRPADSGADPMTDPISLTFATVRGSGTTGALTDTAANDSRNNFFDDTGNAGTFNLSYIAAIADGDSNFIYGLNLMINDVIFSTTGSASVDVDFCVGFAAGAFSGDVSMGNCVGAGGTFVSGAATALAASDNLFNFTFASPVKTVAVSHSFVLDGTGNGPTSFATFTDSWIQQTPEPGTFLLLGMGLAGLILQRRYSAPRKS